MLWLFGVSFLLKKVISVLMECVNWHTLVAYLQYARQTRRVKDCQQLLPHVIWHYFWGLWTQCAVTFIILCKCQNPVQSNDNNNHRHFNGIQSSVTWEHTLCHECVCTNVWGPIHLESLLPLRSLRTTPNFIKMLLKSQLNILRQFDMMRC